MNSVEQLKLQLEEQKKKYEEEAAQAAGMRIATLLAWNFYRILLDIFLQAKTFDFS